MKKNQKRPTQIGLFLQNRPDNPASLVIDATIYTLSKRRKREERKKLGSFENEVHSNKEKQAGKEKKTWGIAVRMGATSYSIKKKEK